MDFAFSPEEEAFRKEVAAFLEKEVPREYREKRLTFFDMSAQHDWIKVHRRMAEKLGAKGWLSMHWPAGIRRQRRLAFLSAYPKGRACPLSFARL